MKTFQLKNLISASLLISAIACATAGPSPQLLRARDAFNAAKSGPALELNPADVHDALVMLEAAEDAGRQDGRSANALNRAYLAEKRAELADAQGRTSAAARDRDRSNQELAALKDAALKTAKSQLAEASSDQQRTAAELNKTQSQLGLEHKERLASDERGAEQREQLVIKDQANKDQIADAAADRKVAQDQLSQKQTELDSEHDARLASEKRAQDSFDALAKVAAVRKEERGMVITLSGSVIFSSGKSALLPSAQHRLEQVADALRANGRTILIEGHTDSLGAASFNQELSERRAAAVRDYLVAQRVPRDRIRSVGLGSSHAVAENNTAEGRANNRRVEIVVESPTMHGN